ncbi:MAG: hypothetical protein WAW42_07575 [Candidatus Competibacteraceae bacterium]
MFLEAVRPLVKPCGGIGTVAEREAIGKARLDLGLRSKQAILIARRVSLPPVRDDFLLYGFGELVLEPDKIVQGKAARLHGFQQNGGTVKQTAPRLETGHFRLPEFHRGGGFVRIKPHFLDQSIRKAARPSPNRGLETWV